MEYGIVAREGVESPATIVRFSPRRVAVSVAAMGLMATVGMWLAVGGGSSFNRVLGVLTALLFGYMFLTGLVRVFRPSYIALMRDGILWQAPTATTFVGWDNIVEVAEGQISGHRFLGLRTKSAPVVDRAPLAFLGRLQRRLSGWDVALPLESPQDEREFVTLVTRCVTDPDERRLLGTRH